jgi:hypothetical protein
MELNSRWRMMIRFRRIGVDFGSLRLIARHVGVEIRGQVTFSYSYGYQNYISRDLVMVNLFLLHCVV